MLAPFWFHFGIFFEVSILVGILVDFGLYPGALAAPFCSFGTRLGPCAPHWIPLLLRWLPFRTHSASMLPALAPFGHEDGAKMVGETWLRRFANES